MAKRKAPPEALQIGSPVRIRSSGQRGELLEIQKDGYLVLLGSMKIRVASENLEVIPQKQKRKSPPPVRSSRGTSRETLSVDLHGLTRKEAEEVLERTLDQALLENARAIEVIHGIGKGVLKKAVESFFQGRKQVAGIKEDLSNPGVIWVYL